MFINTLIRFTQTELHDPVGDHVKHIEMLNMQVDERIWSFYPKSYIIYYRYIRYIVYVINILYCIIHRTIEGIIISNYIAPLKNISHRT